MSEEKDQPIKVTLEASAKLEVKGQLSERATDSLADTVVDLLSPFAQTAALAGDALKLARLSVLRRVLAAAHEISKTHGLHINPLPRKFLLPLLQGAGLEEDDSPLVKRWASLLASAANSYSSRYRAYVDVLEKLSPEDAQYLERFVGPQSEARKAPDFTQLLRTTIHRYIENAAGSRDAFEFFDNAQSWALDLGKFLIPQGVVPARLSCTLSGTQRDGHFESGYAGYEPQRETINYLVGLGLLERNYETVQRTYMGGVIAINFAWVQPSEFGIDFLHSCRLSSTAEH